MRKMVRERWSTEHFITGDHSMHRRRTMKKYHTTSSKTNQVRWHYAYLHLCAAVHVIHLPGHGNAQRPAVGDKIGGVLVLWALAVPVR
ncbi:hypothetical protein GUJ93_ZPchr0003g17006 [Zizania palustris]|uniref:Uncharacterized protein n=1 Tax=Zizania palustris TaxID=103762 RepID=A0A8J5S403_ZIZPA|nr:hypothetical protein GUJ93_ZPchr0003g17006 [Zizania palustris]